MPYYSQKRRPAYGRRTFTRTPNRGPKKQQIDPRRYIQKAKPAEAVAFVPNNQFADFAVHPLLHGNIKAKGLVTPTPIQDQAIPHGIEGRDVVGIANTGTGKTVAFALPVLNRLLMDKSQRALIMAPTRELAQQIEAECKTIARGSGLNGAILIGGTSMGPQLNSLRLRPQIVIGTPGRIKDHMERGTLNVSNFTMVVLDEVDRMLDMGFINDMRFILSRIPESRQSFFFSATMDPKVEGLVHSFLNDPVTVSVKTGLTSDNVEQDIVYSTKEKKMDLLHETLIKNEAGKVLVFDDTQRSVERVSQQLIARGFQADAIHGGKSQGQRQRALARFKKSEVTVLVATDVAARGIDVVDITHVINYSTPQSYEDYIHRIGRAGRAGRKGYALTFIEDERHG